MFVNEYYTRIKKWEFKRRKSALRSVIPHEKYKGEYPAHLHIDVLPEYQRMGLGHKMTDVLLAHLKEKGVKVIFSHANMQPLSVMKKAGFYDEVGEKYFVENIDAALEAAQKMNIE